MKKTVITIASTKGGVGKTTLAANIGALLVRDGKRVMLIDADPQPSLSSYFPIETEADKGFSEFLQQQYSSVKEVVSHTATAGLDFVFSNDSDGDLAQKIKKWPDGRFRLRKLVGSLAYDVVIIDTQGAASAMQEAAILAADVLLSPLPPEALSVREFARGMVEVMDSLRGLADYGINAPKLMGVFYRVDRTRDSLDVMEFLREWVEQGDLGEVGLLESYIPAGVIWREAASLQKAVCEMGYKGKAATQAVADLLSEIGLGGAV